MILVMRPIPAAHDESPRAASGRHAMSLLGELNAPSDSKFRGLQRQHDLPPAQVVEAQAVRCPEQYLEACSTSTLGYSREYLRQSACTYFIVLKLHDL